MSMYLYWHNVENFELTKSLDEENVQEGELDVRLSFYIINTFAKHHMTRSVSTRAKNIDRP